MRNFLSVIILLLNWIGIHAQIVYTRDFTNKLQTSGWGLNIPTEAWFKVNPDCEPAFDLCLVSDKDSAELKFEIIPEKNNNLVLPQFHFVSRVLSLATNDEQYYIRTKPVSARVLENVMHADWAGEISFIPKKTLTDKKYGKAFALYKEEEGMAFIVLYYNYEYPGFNDHLRSIYHSKPK